MAETGDLINEFKQAKPPEKVVIVVGVLAVAGVALYLYKKGQAQSAASTSTGAPTAQTAGYPMAGNTPVLPSGVNPLYDPNGNLIGFQNPPVGGPVVPPNQVNTHAPGSLFLGPTGVHHYVATGGMTLSQIASSLGLQSWNNIYAIPDNQKLFGNLSGNQAAAYRPATGTVITVPTNVSIPQGGGPFGTRVHGQHGRATPAPSREGRSVVARTYRRRAG